MHGYQNEPDEFQTQKKKLKKGTVPTIFLNSKTPKKRKTNEKNKRKGKIESKQY